MPNLPVGVTVNFNGVSYVSGQGWQGTPSWSFDPGNCKAHNGNNNITWTLTANNVPTGYTAGFTADTNDEGGVVFKASNPDPWTGTTPTKQDDGTVQATDNFQNLGASQKFHYTTSVTLTPDSGTTGAAGTWTHDPDVENVSGGGVLEHEGAVYGEAETV